ncbi:MAG: lipoate--protein ligase family protein [Candidatus Bathyarchaeota archaeon]|nr:MAG: lipoate--protein ligase family protein [Candidatus Bathyarchaeota archaeon]
MAIDEAIMQAVAEKKSPPTLRFYGWRPPCVSVGYAQSLRDEIDLDTCRRRGYNWVRRPTGGRAVLHIDDLTYSVTAPQGESRVAGDIITSYQRLSLGLVVGLRSLGCDVIQADLIHTDSSNKSAVCFEVPSHYEVTALERKLVGSAQIRRKGVVLQHGALPLKGDVSRLAEVLALPRRDRERLQGKLRQRAIALDEALGRTMHYSEVADALKKGFSEALNLDLEPGVLSIEEEAAADCLRSLYTGDEWTYSK